MFAYVLYEDQFNRISKKAKQAQKTNQANKAKIY